ncbi:hypothetical protein IVB56_25205 [Bradyrhizobium sp. CW7]|uniref:hypothetical protein n=1 Tax=Bradyrhizobium sp. CW7 TaxID=2782688 RepID=UPI001FF74E1D|nr:hypothetical protein [Bradyrhizobium sp. CW7]MCK1354262.1 hypothetical protein [Bradyrhizobium sp. CW7]
MTCAAEPGHGQGNGSILQRHKLCGQNHDLIRHPLEIGVLRTDPVRSIGRKYRHTEFEISHHREAVRIAYQDLQNGDLEIHTPYLLRMESHGWRLGESLTSDFLEAFVRRLASSSGLQHL